MVPLLVSRLHRVGNHECFMKLYESEMKPCSITTQMCAFIYTLESLKGPFHQLPIIYFLVIGAKALLLYGIVSTVATFQMTRSQDKCTNW